MFYSNLAPKMGRLCPATSWVLADVIFSCFEQNVSFLYKLNPEFPSLAFKEVNTT